MKKIVLFLAFFVAITAVIAQNVPREMVALEIGTGTWCPYCPGAAMGADDLLENGKFVAVIENHNGDGYANIYSNARNAMWAVPGYPTATFDGMLSVVGGSYNQSMYSSYLPKYNASIAVESPVAMTMEVEQTDADYTVTVEMTKVGTISATNIVLYFFVTESHIQQNWQGQTHLNFVNRLMVPDQNGTNISFAGGDVQTVELNFTLDSSFPVENGEFVAMLQNKTPGQGVIPGTYPVNRWEVIQTVKKGVVDLTVEFEASATLVDKETDVTFTNNTTGGYIGVPETYEWLFPGAEPDYSTDESPTVTYSQCGSHDVTLIVDRGGQIDTLVKTAYVEVDLMVEITSDPGDTTCWYQPITLDATKSYSATYLWEPGGATTPTITVYSNDVGLGSHTYTVTITSSGGCENSGTHTIFFDGCVGIDDQPSALRASVYPNPSNGQFRVEIATTEPAVVTIEIVSPLNAVVYRERGISVNERLLHNLNLDLTSGIYYLAIRDGKRKQVRKLIIF